MKTLVFLPMVALIGLLGTPVCAQEEGETAPTQTQRARLRPIESVLQALTRASGITVIAESSLSGAEADYPREAATAETLEKFLDKVVKSLPAGTIWKKAMLPTSTRFYKGDDVVDFLEAQARMLGRGAPGEAGSVEILGQKLAPEKAVLVISTLGLKPVYVLVNPAARQSARDSLAGAGGQADLAQILGNLGSMEPAARMKLMEQFSQMMRSMTPEQRRQMFGGAPPFNAPRRGQSIPPRL